MGYIVYGEPYSGSFMVEAALAEAGQTYDIFDIDFSGSVPDSYRAINPSAKIPALRFPDGTFITQSAAILLALAETHPQARLLPPPGHPDRRAALHWLVFVVSEIYPLVEFFDYPHRFVPDEVDEAGVKERTRERIRERWLIVESASAGQGSFLPSGFSVLDLMVAMVSDWIVGAGWRAAQCPKIEAIHRAILKRPAMKAVWDRHLPAKG